MALAVKYQYHLFILLLGGTFKFIAPKIQIVTMFFIIPGAITLVVTKNHIFWDITQKIDPFMFLTLNLKTISVQNV